MNSRQINELAFWQRCFDEELGNPARWHERRTRDFRAMAGRLWEEINTEIGLGLDLGTGLSSLLGYKASKTPVIAADPLMDEYEKLLPESRSWVQVVKEDGESLSFATDQFDYVWCVNVIDHTPNPEKLLSEIRRVLKPGGHFYFWVNFDQVLGMDCHYTLWRQETVDELLKGFQLKVGITSWMDRYHKYIYAGLYA